MVAFADKFPDAPFQHALYWFLQASRFSRYSGSGTTSLDEDLRDIQEATTLDDAVRRMLLRFPHTTPLEPDDFMRDYADSRFGRFLLYLLVYQNKAQDWGSTGQRLGFEGLDLLTDFRPQWHHIFPKGYLQSHGLSDDLIDALANIAVIGPTINIRISAKEPLDYIARYNITQTKLTQQFIDEDIVQLSWKEFPQWLQHRAETLAHEGNVFLNELRGDL